ncbi:ABC transporter permease [Cellulomonas chitinilytica]|uniref:ABC transporter permease n=1 Tax=Cellulomonas chitinilytica TaxID=398759 RepID=A0A919P705_9CELL|nr:ABC transporter permease [Cellulomonas chitinilytica]GIG22741.1 ABC transporter permease [Cellulomonas chitinilytica]
MSVLEKDPPKVVEPARATASGQPFWRRLLFVVAAYLLCLAVFAAFAATQGADPASIFTTMLQSSVLDWGTLQQTLVRSVPIVLAALACTIPARAGLVNVGGEGQIIMGSVAAVGVGLALGQAVGGPVAWLAIVAGAAVAGAVWCGICGFLRVRLNASESVTTLFFNFIAADVMLYVIYQVWREGDATSLPQSEPLTSDQLLPAVGGLQLTLAVPFMVLVVVGVWALLKYTSWGFRLTVAGGNPTAALRSGLPVRRILLGSMLAGGALAGIGGALNVMGAEGALRPGMTATFGYVAFLANFLGGSRPFPVLGAAVLFSAIANSGNGLQLSEGLNGSAVNVLLGLIVLTMLVVSGRTKEAFS